MKDVELKDLVGTRMLEGVDLTVESIKDDYGDRFSDSEVCRFRLDGVTYTAIQDPDDGYRSTMRSLHARKNGAIKNRFEPVPVLASYRDRGPYGTADILDLREMQTGRLVLSVGTEDMDDYYPSFISSFHPEALGEA